MIRLCSAGTCPHWRINGEADSQIDSDRKEYCRGRGLPVRPGHLIPSAEGIGR